MLRSTLLGTARANSVNEDFVCRVIRAVRRVGCVERIPWHLVHLRVQILDFILVNHPYQVGFWVEKIG